MTRKLIVQRLLVGSALALSLAACGGGGSSTVDTSPPKVTATSQEDKFGTVFGTDFRTAMNTDPAPTVNDGDIVPVSLTTEPIDIVG